MRKRASRLCLCLVATAFLAMPARASPITYTEQAVATGSLGRFDFVNQLVTITVSADSAGVIYAGDNEYINAGLGTVSVGVSGPASFVDPLSAFVYAGPLKTVLGITDPYGFADVLDADLPPSLPFDLTSAIAPQSGDATINPFFLFATSAGDFDLITARDAVFSASFQPVPEPASRLLLATGLGFALALSRRTKNMVY